MNIEERIKRLERALLSYTALVTGEAAKVMNTEELEVVQHQLGVDLSEMQEDQ